MDIGKAIDETVKHAKIGIPALVVGAFVVALVVQILKK